jgi:uncharacterized lipoprotein YmbA
MLKTLTCTAMLMLCGCSILGSSPKTHFYTLNAVTVPNASDITVRLVHPVTVAAVHIPPSLDRTAMVVYTDANSVGISGIDRWTGPLGPMARRVLSEDLAAHLSRANVIMPGAPAPADTHRIVVTVIRFGPAAGGDVVLDANWSVIGVDSGAPILRRDVQFREHRVAEGGNAIAAAMSRLLARLAKQMATVLTAL